MGKFTANSMTGHQKLVNIQGIKFITGRYKITAIIKKEKGLNLSANLKIILKRSKRLYLLLLLSNP